MTAASLNWAPRQLQADLCQEWPGIEVRVVGETASTNTDLLERARESAVRQQPLRPLVWLAEAQTAGRGRQGRTWQSQPGTSLTFSIGLSLRPRHGWGALSLVVGQAVARVLQPWPVGTEPDDPGRLLLKWPNDLWWYDHAPRTPSERAAGRKVGGILIETLSLPAASVDLSGQRWVVVGIGLNVRPLALQGMADPMAAAVSQWCPEAHAPDLWHRIVPQVLRDIRSFEADGFEPHAAEVLRRELLIGQPVSLSAGAVREGHCIGIDQDGALRVQTVQGEQRVVAGEVSVRPQAGPHQA